MAIYPGFTFADPALQKTVSDEAIAQYQLQAQQEQARNAALDRLSREREARAIRQSEIDRNDRALRQQDLQFQQSLAQRELESKRNADLYGTYNKDYQSTADQRAKEAASTERYNALQRILQDTSDPMTPLEFEAQAEGLTPERKQLLRSILDSTRNKAANFAVEAERAKRVWDAKLAGVDLKKGITPEKVLDDFNKSKDKDYLSYDPTTGFVPRFKRPRQDVPFGPQEAPAVTGGPGQVQTIEQLRASLMPSEFGAIQPFATKAISGIMDAITNPRMPAVPAPVTTIPPVAPSTAPLFDYRAIQNSLQRLGILPGYVPPQPPPPPRMLGNEGVLAPLEYP